jgi:hypothetical protein
MAGLASAIAPDCRTAACGCGAAWESFASTAAPFGAAVLPVAFFTFTALDAGFAERLAGAAARVSALACAVLPARGEAAEAAPAEAFFLPVRRAGALAAEVRAPEPRLDLPDASLFAAARAAADFALAAESRLELFAFAVPDRFVCFALADRAVFLTDAITSVLLLPAPLWRRGGSNRGGKASAFEELHSGPRERLRGARLSDDHLFTQTRELRALRTPVQQRAYPGAKKANERRKASQIAAQASPNKYILTQKRAKIKRYAAPPGSQTIGETRFCLDCPQPQPQLVALTRIRREVSVEFARHAVKLLGVRRRLALNRYVRPRLGHLGIKF